jgi:hypothetical protein
MTIPLRAAKSQALEALHTTHSMEELVGPGADPADDRRFACRRATATPGYLTSSELSQTYAVTLLDTSSTGALARVQFNKDHRFKATDDLPDRLMLVIQFERVAIECQIVWRRDTEIGLRFLSPARPMGAPKSRHRPVVAKPAIKRRRLF